MKDPDWIMAGLIVLIVVCVIGLSCITSYMVNQ